MENLLLSLNIILPIFLIMVVGYVFRRIGMMDAENVSVMNKLVFRLFLPCSLCKSIMTVDKNAPMNYLVLLYCSGIVFLTCVAGFLIIPRIEKENAKRGVMIQGLFRSNYAIFGVPLSQALFPNGDGGVAAMMVVATIPLFNVLGVITLESFRGGRADLKKILKGILKNPLIWGCLIGFVLLEAQLPIPKFATDTLSKLGSVASPFALFVLGGSINLRSFRENIRQLTISVLGRLIIVPVVGLAVAYLFGIRGVEFGVLMIALGAPCAVNSYTMAAQMDGDADLAGQQVMLTTVLCSFTMFLFIFVFKTIGIF